VFLEREETESRRGRK